MANGKVVSIFTAPARGAPIVSVNQVHAIPGLGIEGDRFFGYARCHQGDIKKGREITLIETEVIETLNNEHGVQMSADQARRNIVTHGVSLNDFVGHHFLIGELQLYGVRLCEPCQYLADRTDPRILPLMINKGGLRAQIITEGTIHIGDTITSLD